MDAYENLRKLGLELPTPPPPGGLYVPVKQVGNFLYTSGQGATRNGKPLFTGKVGAELTVEEGQQAARLCVLNLLSVLHAFTGDLNRIKNVVKVLALVASAPGFGQQPLVVNGGSQLLIDVFGERGKHCRSAMGTNELPGNIPVEIEAIFEI
ncbi:MAG: RidA family protein [Treponemataceae bacterium]